MRKMKRERERDREKKINMKIQCETRRETINDQQDKYMGKLDPRFVKYWAQIVPLTMRASLT